MTGNEADTEMGDGSADDVVDADKEEEEETVPETELLWLLVDREEEAILSEEDLESDPLEPESLLKLGRITFRRRNGECGDPWDSELTDMVAATESGTSGNLNHTPTRHQN